MAFIYNLTDTWTSATTTWNGIKLAVTNTSSDASSNLLNLTVTGATTASFVVDKSGNLALNGTVNKITMTAPATGATLTLADGSSFITSGAYSTTFTTTGTTTLTLPTSGTVTALGNTTTGSGSIVLASSPTLVTPALGTPSSVTLTNATGLPLTTGVTGTLAIANGGTGQTTANDAFNALAPSQGGNSGKYLTTDGTNTSWATNPLGTVTSVDVSGGTTGISFSGGPITTSGTITMSGTLAIANGGTGITSFGTGVATALGVNIGSAGAFVVNGGALGTPSSGTLTNATGLPISTGVSGLGTDVATFLATPSSANLASAVTDETGSGPLVFATSPTFTSAITLGTQGTTQGSLVLANTASTYATTIKSSNSATAAYTLTLPTTAGTNGYFLQTDGLGNLAWAAGGGGGGGSVAGSDKQIQFNDAGSFGASANFLFDKTTYTMTLGLASTATGVLAFGNSSSANLTKIQAGNASAAVTYTLPTADGTNGQALITNGSGALSWTTIASGLTVGTTAITGGTSGRILYDNAGVLGEKTITGTGDVVLATSPTLVTPLLGTPTSGTLTNCTGLPVSTGISGLGTGVATFLATPSSANLASAVTDETGSGSLVFGTTPTFTTNITAPLVIGGTTASSSLTLQSTSGVGTSDSILFKVGDNGATTAATINSVGNLGLGVTPSAWATYSGVLEFAGGANIEGYSTGFLGLGSNHYYNGTNFIYKISSYANRLSMDNTGAFKWYTAPSGTAGNAITFTEAMTLDASGNLGIGTSPAAGITLDLLRTSLCYQRFRDGTNYFQLGTDAAVSPAAFLDATNGYRFFVNGAEKVRIDSSGNVGIGTSSPVTNLQISKASVAEMRFTNTSGTSQSMDVGTQTGLNAHYIYCYGAYPLLFATNGSERMRIDSSGNVGIGTTSPTNKLDITGTAAASQVVTRIVNTSGTSGSQAVLSLDPGGNGFNSRDGQIRAENNGGNQISLLFYTSSAATPAERMRIDSSGNVLVTGAGGLGYGTGSGGAVTQITNRTTGVTLNKTNGAITLVSAAGSTTAATFTVTNSTVAATDTVVLSQKTGTNLYDLMVTAVAAGSFNISLRSASGTATEAPVINFAVIKAVTS